MNTTATSESAITVRDGGNGRRVNDVVITVATSNGTGSQSANLILLRTIFAMGVPVSGKNMFPSNIQGLPTWFTIRANARGWLARRADADIMVAMNVESVADDIASLRPGATLILHEDLKRHLNRDDLRVHLVPFGSLVAAACPDARLRRLAVNIMYVGVLAWLLDLDLDEMRRALGRQFASKPRAAELNEACAMAAFQWAAENLPRSPEHVIRRAGLTEGMLLMEGNHATALGLLFGGISVLAWYPITPSSSVCEVLIDYLAKYRHDPVTGRATYATVQAEDELGAMAMVVGAGWAGARAATATSGPGISLMAELAGLAHFAEIPAVIVDVQRMGPSTGLPTRTSQGDILSAFHLSHGDCRHPLLIPADMRECYEFAALAPDLAERLQTPVFVMTDLDLGMNTWMTEPFDVPDRPIDRGKVLDAAALEDVAEFARYRDVDGDAIPYRTLPGTRNPKAAFYTRGTGHTDRATYSEKATDWAANLGRLARKLETARALLPPAVIDGQPGAAIGILAYGSSDPAIGEARAILAEEHGVATSYCRVRALPAGDDVAGFLASHRVVLVVEQNRDGQMAAILRAEFPRQSAGIRVVAHYNGLPLDAATVVAAVTEAGGEHPAEGNGHA